MAVSPNRSLVCSVSQSDLGIDASAFIHSFPVKTGNPLSFLYSTHKCSVSSTGRETKQVSVLLQLGFQKRDALSDVIHHLTVRETSLSVLEDAISNALSDLENQNIGLFRPSINTMLGTIIEIYRYACRLSINICMYITRVYFLYQDKTRWHDITKRKVTARY